jgi:hypothetical protein
VWLGVQVSRRDNGLVMRNLAVPRSSYATLGGVTAYTWCEYFCGGQADGHAAVCGTTPPRLREPIFSPAPGAGSPGALLPSACVGQWRSQRDFCDQHGIRARRIGLSRHATERPAAGCRGGSLRD